MLRSARTRHLNCEKVTELCTLDAICLWCTSVHIITFLLFALAAPIDRAARPQ